MFDEDTGETPTCPICGEEEEMCDHLVAIIDRTYNEVRGGALYDNEHRFSEAIEDSFRGHLKAGTAPTLEDGTLKQLWADAAENHDDGSDEVVLDQHVLYHLIERSLLSAGAAPYAGSVIEEAFFVGGTSSMALLYAEDPPAIVERALAALREKLPAP